MHQIQKSDTITIYGGKIISLVVDGNMTEYQCQRKLIKIEQCKTHKDGLFDVRYG